MMPHQRFQEIDKKMWEIASIGDGEGGDFRTGLRFNKSDTGATDEELKEFGLAYGLHLHICECGKSYFSWE